MRICSHAHLPSTLCLSAHSLIQQHVRLAVKDDVRRHRAHVLVVKLEPLAARLPYTRRVVATRRRLACTTSSVGGAVESMTPCLLTQ
jgi:hypothetical protein